MRQPDRRRRRRQRRRCSRQHRVCIDVMSQDTALDGDTVIVKNVNVDNKLSYRLAALNH